MDYSIIYCSDGSVRMTCNGVEKTIPPKTSEAEIAQLIAEFMPADELEAQASAPVDP